MYVVTESRSLRTAKTATRTDMVVSGWRVRSMQREPTDIEMRLRKQLADLLIVSIPIARAEWAPRESDIKRLREVLRQYDGNGEWLDWLRPEDEK